MPHSYVTSLFHIVFSTKERRQLIRADLRPRLWNYLAAIARNHGVHVIAVGGIENHVHILLTLPPNVTLQDVVRTLKCNSTRLVREESHLFSWQEGYAAFSVSSSQVERVTRYMANQAEHHRKRSFDDEFVAMLEAAKIPSAGSALRAAPEGA